MSIVRLSSSPSYTLYQRLPRIGPSGVIFPPPPFVPDFYVSPTGGTGSGSILDPWSLAYAIGQGVGTAQGDGKLGPGNKVALRGGNYNGNFISRTNGLSGNPIIFRQQPGERATLRPTGRALETHGSYTWFWGFEIAGPSSSDGVNNMGIQNKLIHLIIHDVAATAIGSGISNFPANGPQGGEFYGNILYNNGSSNFDHGIYAQNDDTFGTLFVLENIMFNNWAFGFHCFIQPGEFANGIDAEGNIIFNNSSIGLAFRDNEVVIGGNTPVTRNIFSNNFVYRDAQTNIPLWNNYATVDLGLAQHTGNGSIVCQNNYIVGGLNLAEWLTAIISGNLQYNYSSGQLVNNLGSLAGHAYTGDSFYGDPAINAFLYNGFAATTLANWKTQTGFVNPGTYAGLVPPNAVFVRPSIYEAGRANIIVYNWTGAATVNADLSAVLQIGQAYNIYNVQDMFGIPVASGVYNGFAISLPTAGIAAPVPIGRGHAGPVTGPTFQVFVVRLQGA